MTKVLDTCGCCDEDIPGPELFNRPGLPALFYRVGAHGTFLQRMLARLPRTLASRAPDDPSIALLDAWATVGDVLTFYQERLANEGYLRTAIERRSILELARSIGYELNPGVAASAFLAFTVEDAQGAPGLALVTQGTKVQSTPGPGETPQTFETSASITARAEWNALRPRQSRPQELAIDATGKLFLLGISTSLGVTPTDASLYFPLDASFTIPGTTVEAAEVTYLYLEGTTNLKAGDMLLLVGRQGATNVETRALSIQSVQVDDKLKRTRIDLNPKPPAPPPSLPFFYPLATITLTALTFNNTILNTHFIGRTWRERDLGAFALIQGWSRRHLVAYANTPPPAPKLDPSDPGVFGFRAKTSPFGHNAPRWDALPLSQRYAEGENAGKPIAYPISWDDQNEPNIKQMSRPDPNIPASTDRDTYQNRYGLDFFFERPIPEVTLESWLVLEKPGERIARRVAGVGEASLVDFSLSAKATGVQVEAGDGDLTTYKMRSTTIYAQSERLELAQMPIEEVVASGSTSLQLDRVVLGLQVNQPLILSGEVQDLHGVKNSEAVILTDIQHAGGFTTLFFQDPLQRDYIRSTVTLNANVARATHGESVTEPLGSGDGSQPNQRFTLKKSPLTYVSSSSASGSESTLTVRVGGVEWEEVARLYRLEPTRESYIIRIDDDGKATVIFGDGHMGARLPTGRENIQATYRAGIGSAGMVGSNKLTMLMSIPLGVRGVTNPLPAEGAADPETRDQARDNAPLTVLTLERIVSLRDFEDFVRAFAGIGKAQAVMLSKGQAPLIYVTVASATTTASPDLDEGGGLTTNVVNSTSDLYLNLVKAIGDAADPALPFQVGSYQPVFFNVTAKVLVDPRYLVSEVWEAVENALKAHFAFEQRAFGQGVTEAEVITVFQKVAGVIAVDLDQLYRYEEGQTPPAPGVQTLPEDGLLPGQQVCWDVAQNQARPAELLLLNPAGITLEEMTV